jgi:mannose/fructose/sorbose-specific phosphotransferase system IIB component
MSSLFIRIDDRLIHGTVVQSWVRTLHINHIVVADDRVASDDMQKTLLLIAVPPSLKVSIFGVKEAVVKLKSGDIKNDNILVLVSSPSDALGLVKNGVTIESINVGGLHFTPGKKQILKAVSVDEKDIDAFCQISTLGVKLEVRVIPTDNSIDIMSCLKK